MGKLYAKWMHDWETRLCLAATDRVVRPFDWGLEWTNQWPVTRQNPRNGHDAPASYLRLLNQLALLASSWKSFSRTPCRPISGADGSGGAALDCQPAALQQRRGDAPSTEK